MQADQYEEIKKYVDKLSLEELRDKLVGYMMSENDFYDEYDFD